MAYFDNFAVLDYTSLRTGALEKLYPGASRTYPSKESTMTKKGMTCLALILVMAMLAALPGCQKKQIASEAAYGTSGSGAGMGGAAGRKGIGEQDLGGAGSRPGAGMGSVSPTDRATFENEDIYFGYDSSSLSSEAQDILRKKGAFLKANPNVKVTIEGHCDERGTNEYNLALGEARARTAKNFLVDLGVPAARLATISYGEERPIAKGQSEEAYAKNRRAHFVIEQ
jgi:peptidoglycan-associated lipoprotein